MFLRASCVKFGGPFARNDHVGSFFCEISVISFISYDHVISVSLFSSTSRFYILYFQWPWLGEVLLTTNPLITARRCHLYHMIWIAISFPFSSMSRFYILYFQWPWLGEVLLTTNPLITARRCHLYHMIGIAISLLFSSMSRFCVSYFTLPWLFGAQPDDALMVINPCKGWRICLYLLSWLFAVIPHVFVLFSFADCSCLSQYVFTPGRPMSWSEGCQGSVWAKVLVCFL